MMNVNGNNVRNGAHTARGNGLNGNSPFGFTPEDTSPTELPITPSTNLVIYYDTGPVFRKVFGTQTFQDFTDFESKFLKFQEITGVIFRIKSSVSVGAENKKRTIKIDDKFKYGGVTYICVRHGINKTSKGTSCNCKAYLSLSYKNAIQRLYITSANTKHNHPLPINNPEVLIVPTQEPILQQNTTSINTRNPSINHFKKFSPHDPSQTQNHSKLTSQPSTQNVLSNSKSSTNVSTSSDNAAAFAAALAASFFYSNYHQQQNTTQNKKSSNQFSFSNYSNPPSPLQKHQFEQGDQEQLPFSSDTSMKGDYINSTTLSNKNKADSSGHTPGPPNKFMKYDFLAAAEQYKKFYDTLANNFKYGGSPSAPSTNSNQDFSKSISGFFPLPPGIGGGPGRGSSSTVSHMPPSSMFPPDFLNFAHFAAAAAAASSGKGYNRPSTMIDKTIDAPTTTFNASNFSPFNSNKLSSNLSYMDKYGRTFPNTSNHNLIKSNASITKSTQQHLPTQNIFENAANYMSGSGTLSSHSAKRDNDFHSIISSTQFNGSYNNQTQQAASLHLMDSTSSANTSSALINNSHTPIQQQQQQMPLSASSTKYSQLLAVIEDMGRDIRPAYAGSRVAAERLKRGIVHSRILVRECLLEAEKSTRS